MLAALPAKLVWPTLGLLLLATLLAGCARNNPNNPAHARNNPGPYERREPKQNVPAFLQGSIFQYTDLENTDLYPVSGFGLVVNLRGTGDSTAPMAVREYMIRQMVAHGFGGRRIPGYENRQPEEVLRDPRVAIVRVDGFIPPGSRVGDVFDAYVSALAQSRTTSLAGGDLFRTDLRLGGANELNPGGAVNVYARVEGSVFVNPAYVLEPGENPPPTLRRGVIMDGGRNMVDRPLVLRLRQPERRMARLIEARVDERFQQSRTAAAQNEAEIFLYMPSRFNGDWERFVGVVNHLYLDNSPAFIASKAQELAAEALKPDAPLQNISYAWEALGPSALPYIRPLMWHRSPDVAFAAARAAAFLGDHAAREALADIARKPDHPYQLSAVQILGAMPASQAVNDTLRRLLDSDQTLIRIEAYKVLAANRDPRIYSRVIRQRFVLDIVPSAGPPLVYASRSGIPRIAVIGEKTGLAMPFFFRAFDNTLTISAGEKDQAVTVFYRGRDVPQPQRLLSRPDLPEIIARLGGEAAPGAPRLNFSYGEIVAMIQAMSDADKLTGTQRGEPAPIAFVLQELGEAEEAIITAPAIPEVHRTRDDPRDVGLNMR